MTACSCLLFVRVSGARLCFHAAGESEREGKDRSDIYCELSVSVSQIAKDRKSVV